MRYHNITFDDMLNGSGLRVVLWVSGCEHHCPNCQNPITWDKDGGIPFDSDAEEELFAKLGHDHIAGLTFSGGDPLHPANREEVERIAYKLKHTNAGKDIWLYTGYLWENVKDLPVMRYIDVLVDGPFKESMKDTKAYWVGSTNQRIIDVQESLKLRDNWVCLWDDTGVKEPGFKME